jgi:hypothetical protein
VISHRLWQQAYGEDRAVLGATVHLNGTPLTIVGVAQPRFDYPHKTNGCIPTDDPSGAPKSSAISSSIHFRFLQNLMDPLRRSSFFAFPRMPSVSWSI